MPNKAVLLRAIRRLGQRTPPPQEPEQPEKKPKPEEAEEPSPEQEVTLKLEDEVGYVQGKKREPTRHPIE